MNVHTVVAIMVNIKKFFNSYLKKNIINFYGFDAISDIICDYLQKKRTILFCKQNFS